MAQEPIGRIPILELSPVVDGGRWPARAFSGEVVPFGATVFREGHDLIGADLLLTDPAGATESRRMSPGVPGTDRFGACAQLSTEGVWRFRVRAYSDDYASWLHSAEIKIPAGIDPDLTLASGAELLQRASRERGRQAPERRILAAAATAALETERDPLERFAVLSGAEVLGLLASRPIVSLTTLSREFPIRVERERAGLGAWYEYFPRSEGAVRLDDGTWRSGTLRTAAERLPAIAEMGFDVVYLPPIHPIGTSFRKGPDNSPTAGPGDPGSPWAIGAADGGHDAIHPDLGTVEDFAYFLAAARESGLEVALDLALQASPDHPWVREHPEWFTVRPDGSIAYAENPPKKYQDIYPINFDRDPDGIRSEVLRIVRYWMGLGVRIFRVDNPHTKPVPFWEWLIRTVNTEDPGVVFLAEAFTRPAMLRTLAKVGFQQSYTYFTWRNTKPELEEFLTSISSETAAYLRPNLFVNTPDILTEYLQFGGPAAFKVRAAIAATASPSWGVYSGYELYENVARAGAEESAANEKYEYRPRDYSGAESRGGSLAPYLRMLNRARAEHPALRQLRNLELHASDDDAILVYSKHLDAEYTGSGASDTVIVVANLDPHSVRESIVRLDLGRIGREPGAILEAEDLVTGSVWTWSADNYVRLDAFTEPVHILSVRSTS